MSYDNSFHISFNDLLKPNPRTCVGKAWPLKGGIHCSLRSQCCPLCHETAFYKHPIYFSVRPPHRPDLSRFYRRRRQKIIDFTAEAAGRL